jgi:hypothetical protein
MTTLNIQGQSVNVSDDFLKLSPEEQDSTVQDIARQMGIASKPTEDVSALSAAQSLPIVGAYTDKAAAYLRHLARGGTTAEHEAQIKQEIADYRQQHPVESTIGDVAVGSLPYMAAGEFALPAKALGMVGAARTAIPLAGASGAAIGAADALARGESPMTGAAVGALTGAGGVAAGKALGRVWDAARGMWVDRPRIPNTIDVNGRPVPVRESVVTRDPRVAGEEQDMLGAQVPTAVQAENDTRTAMQQAHSDLAQRLNPQGTGTGTAMDAGQAAIDDLITQEQNRAQSEIARIIGVGNQQQTLARDLGGGIAGPATTPEVGEFLGQGVRGRFGTARQATRTAYGTAAAVPASYNPRYLIGAGETIRRALDQLPGDARVRINPGVTPQAQAALDTIDQEVAQLRFTNDAARGNRPITPADMEQVRKQLVIQRRMANNTARMTGNWEDARAVGRVMEAFDAFEQATATRPGGLLTGNPADVLATRQAARAAHAQERATFSRRGPGDVVGTFMENVVGKYPGQEMSPDKIVRSILGTPGGAIPENAVPILNHLRDNVFGPNSQEWAAVKRSVLSHLTEAPAGNEPLALAEQASRIERFLGNERHASAIFDPAEQARLQQHADTIRAARDEPPARGTIEQKVAQLSGRLTGEAATGEQLVAELFKTNGAKLVDELQRVSPQSIPALKEGVFRKVTSAPQGATDWGDQKIANAIANFAKTDLAQRLYTANELAMLRTIGEAHKQLLPLPRTANVSASAYTGARMMKGLTKQFLAMIGSTHGLHGYAIGHAIGAGTERIGAARQARRAADLFLGQRAPLPRQGQYVPQAIAARTAPSLRYETTDQQ